MKRSYTINIILLLLSLALMAGCTNSDGRITDEGTVTYKLVCPMSWEYNKKNDNLLSLFPQNISLHFKNNNSVLYIKGLFFMIKYLTRYDEGRNYTAISIGMNDNMMCVQDTSQTAFGYNDMEDLKITNTEDTLTVAGYLCKKAIAECPARNMRFDVWYTQNIKIKNANSNNAFKNIDGVPMKFDILLMNFYMHLEAVDVKYDKVGDEWFEIPDFKSGSKQELMEFMNHYMRNN